MEHIHIAFKYNTNLQPFDIINCNRIEIPMKIFEPEYRFFYTG